MLLDTPVLIDLLKNHPPAVRKLAAQEEKNEAFSVTAVTVFELIQGNRVCCRKKKNTWQLACWSVLPFFRSISNQPSRPAESSELFQKNGKTIEKEDCLIAGIAKTHNETILTKNTAHFLRIKETRIESH